MDEEMKMSSHKLLLAMLGALNAGAAIHGAVTGSAGQAAFNGAIAVFALWFSREIE
jgi:hypothetical protein